MKQGRPHAAKRSQSHLDFIFQIGRRIRKARVAAGYSQKEFAELIECRPAAFCRVEQGTHALNLYSFRLACKVLGKDANMLLGRKRKK